MPTPAQESRMSAALLRWGNAPVQIDTTVVDLHVIAGALQLALRHPTFPAHSHAILTRHLEHWIAVLGRTDPALAELLTRGNDPAYDVPTEES